MVKPLAETGLPPPQFLSTDPLVQLQAAIASFERETGRRLHPAQPERLSLNCFAYELNLHAIRVEEAMRQGLVDFARFPMLDYLGRFQGVERLPPAPAQTTLRFTRQRSPGAPPIEIAKGTRVAAGEFVFETDAARRLAAEAGEQDPEVLCPATALIPGETGNGFAPGQIDRLIAPIPGVSVCNATLSAGGAGQETDEALRARILDAAEGLTTAGSRDAYKARAREVSPAITAAGVHSPRPGEVTVTILTRTGLPSPELLARTQTHLSDRRVRPMGDLVRVLPPQRIGFAIEADLTLTGEADDESTFAAAYHAASTYAETLGRTLGRDLVSNQIRAALLVPGVQDLKLRAPDDRVLAADEWADCERINLTFAGRAHD